MNCSKRGELNNCINMDDCHGESYEIFDCMSEFGKVKPLRYKGWQPRCLLEIVDEAGKVVLRGYGEDHSLIVNCFLKKGCVHSLFYFISLFPTSFT